MVISTDPRATGEGTFDLCGGHPALDFVNSLDNRFNGRDPIERLQSYDDLLRFAYEARLLDTAPGRQIAHTLTPDAATKALRAGRSLREALATIFYAVLAGRRPPSAALQTLEHCLHSADRHRDLRWRASGSEPAGLSWSWRSDEGNAELPVWVVAQAALDLLLSPEVKRVRACEAATCRWLFLDTSKNHMRRWCKMKVCGNRMKARRFQARHSG
jgi:predicted RNA-binding Zn ribbon-like protein